MAGYSLAAVATFAGKVYGYLKGVFDFFDEDETDVADLIEQAKNEILQKIVETDHLEVKDHVGGYINSFKTLPYLPPAHQNLGAFIQNGWFIIERLETYLVEKAKDVSRSEAYVYQHDGEYAYHDAAPYNLVVLIQAAALKMANAGPAPICALYRRAYAVNLELIGEPTSQPLPFTSNGGYTSPNGVRCFLVSRLWKSLYEGTTEEWKAGALTVTCQPAGYKLLTSYSHIPCVHASASSGGSYGLVGAASQAEQKKCLDLFKAKFDQDPVVAHIVAANEHLIDLMRSCSVSVRDVASSLQKPFPFSARTDLYGAEPTDRPLREMSEIVLSRS